MSKIESLREENEGKKMNNDKLTLEDCFKYYKAGIVDNVETYGSITDIFDGNSPYCITDLVEILSYGGCKLILRDISQLTDEEKMHIVREYLIDIEMSRIEWTFEELMMCAVSLYGGENYCKELTDYLREKNIMIEKPDWFEIGKAVKDV